MTPIEQRIAIVLLAKSAIAAQPGAEMAALAAEAERRAPGTAVFPAYSEQGTPSLRDRLRDIAARGFPEVRIVPVLLPMEPAFAVWIRKAVAHWLAEMPAPHPAVRLAGGPNACPSGMMALLDDLMAGAAAAEVIEAPEAPKAEGSLVPAQRYRVLVCAGGPCNDAGSAVVWGHLRNEQDRLKLRTAGDGMMSCKTTCLGPCNLAPVVQVWPEGTVYGGVDEAGIDRILAEHVGQGHIVTDLAYAATGKKQTLRRS
jgi:(2Fe-2S) ferredoxin